jgi:predicted Fe-Mo cluster-binding NifX family protein
MKIAVATDDFTNITGHIGRCNGFLIYLIEDENIMSTEQRENTFTNHKKAHDNHQQHSHGHGHYDLIEGLSDCSHLICTSAGWRLKNDFSETGKELIFTDESNAETAVNKFINGTLIKNSDGLCHSH